MSTAVLKIEGMTCNHCVGAVERALRDQEGVNDARVNLQAGTAEVDLKPGTDPRSLIAAVEEEGYTARISG